MSERARHRPDRARRPDAVVGPATSRTRPLDMSAMSSAPVGVTATPSGKESWAAIAGPPSPDRPPEVLATVVMTPARDTRRIRSFCLSAMRKPPSARAATPLGRSSSADVAKSLSPANPGVPAPAAVTIVPPGRTRRMRWLSESAMRKPPSLVTATPVGELSWAVTAGPPSPE